MSMIRGIIPAAGAYGLETSAPQLAASAAGIGQFENVTGTVTVTRANVVAQAIAGDSLYCGDVIETGEEGSASLTFADGTRFQLYASTRMVVDNFVGGAHSSAGSALIRIVKGMFAVIAGKLASAGRLVIETPLGTIRSRGPAAGIGSLAFGLLTFSLIKELRAQGAGPPPSDAPSGPDHTIIDDNDLKLGKLTW